MRSDGFKNVSFSSKFWQTNLFIWDILKNSTQKYIMSQGINIFARDNFRAKRLHLSGKLLNEHFALKTLKIVWGNLHM